nr:glycosyltransferase family 39 protein [Bacteroidota bacterium]
MSKKSIHITLGVLILLYLVTNFLALNESVIYVPDSGRYLIWANSIARGEGYRDATSPEPTRYVVHSPLYALFLAPSQMIFPNSIEAAKATTVLFGALAILAFFLLLKMFFPEEYALWGAILFMLHPETINYSTQVLTEIPFVCVTLYAIILVQRYTTNENNSSMTKAAIAILVSMSVLLREVGVVFAFAVILYLFLMKKRRAAVMLLTLVIAVYGAWFVRNEIIVASQENPATRNSKIFSIHMYTSNSDSMLEEYTARVVT